MFTVAVKRENALVQFCGLYERRMDAKAQRDHLVQSWENAAMRAPRSIRVREVEEKEFWQNQHDHGYTGIKAVPKQAEPPIAEAM